jgi:hypothetical protein
VRFLRISGALDRLMGMNTTYPPVGSNYSFGYARGRRAARERIPAAENPFRAGSSAFHGWSDGHYDEQSARSVAFERHSALIWGRDGCR